MADHLVLTAIASSVYGLSVMAVIIPLYFAKRRQTRAGLIPVVIPAAFGVSALSLSGGLINLIQTFRRFADEQSGDLETAILETEGTLKLTLFGATVTLLILAFFFFLFISLFRSKQVDIQPKQLAYTRKRNILTGLTIVPTALAFTLLIYGNLVCITPMSVLVSDPAPGLVSSYVLSPGYHDSDDPAAVADLIADRFVSALTWSLIACFAVFPVLAAVSAILGRGVVFSREFVRRGLWFLLVICTLLVLYLIGLGAQATWLQEVISGS